MYNSVGMHEFVNLKNINILDVRQNDEYAGGHIPNTVHIPLYEIPNRVEELDINKTYYIVCYSGSRSQQACSFLSQMGYNVVNVLGGMSAYRGELSYEM